MKKTLMIALFVIGSIGAVLAAIADLNGKWTGTVVGPDGNNYPLTYNFKASGATLTGTTETSFGTATIDKGKIEGDIITFSTSLNGMDLPQKGKVYADSIGLDIDYNGTMLHATLKKAAAAK